MPTGVPAVPTQAPKPSRNNKDLSINTAAVANEALKRSQPLSASRLSSSAANLARGLTTRKAQTLPPADHITPFPLAPKSPVESLHPSSAAGPPPTPKTAIRVAIGDQSKTVILEVDAATKPNDVLDMIRAKGLLRAVEGELGEWAVFEVWRDLGLERPIREAETISSVMATWTPNSDTTYLVAKPSLVGGLAVSNRAVTSGPYGGYLHCELKPGKWSKRYVVLQNQAIYLCANDKGKDEIFLCTLSNFDVYQVPPSANAKLNPPRACAFGIKSLDKLSFFETQTDYVHHFAIKNVGQADEWFRRIYDARTFVILRTKAATESAAADKAAEAARQRKRSNSAATANPVSRSASTASRQTAASGLSRQGTLLGDVEGRTFRQGTLLGDLDQSMTPAVPALPNHITTAAAPAATPLRAKAWEAMGPAERKGLVQEAQTRAKQDGKTLLSFPETGAAGGLLRAKSTAGNNRVGTSADPRSAPLGRSQTVAARPPR